MALFFCGIVLSHYNWYNISPVSQATTKQAFKSFAILAETFLFAYLGITTSISFRPNKDLQWSVLLIIFALLLCLIGRAVHIFPFSFMANCVRKKKITFNMQVLMWFAGLRGAIAFALALNLDTDNKNLLVTTTITIVMFTTLILGGLTSPFIRRLGLNETQENTEPLFGERSSVSRIESELPDIESKEDSKKKGKKKNWIMSWKHFDQYYMKRWFGGSDETDRKARDTLSLDLPDGGEFIPVPVESKTTLYGSNNGNGRDNLNTDKKDNKAEDNEQSSVPLTKSKQRSDRKSKSGKEKKKDKDMDRSQETDTRVSLLNSSDT